jgi:hypothetical protein
MYVGEKKAFYLAAINVDLSFVRVKIFSIENWLSIPSTHKHQLSQKLREEKRREKLIKYISREKKFV